MKEGGGVALCARKDLSPTFVSDGGDNFEAVTVNIHLKGITISVTSAYGPQESDNSEGGKMHLGHICLIKVAEQKHQEMVMFFKVI